jgi:hypothetical protein
MVGSQGSSKKMDVYNENVSGNSIVQKLSQDQFYKKFGEEL